MLVQSERIKSNMKLGNGFIPVYHAGEFLKKDSEDIGPAVCYTIYVHYLSLWTQTADPISSEPFSTIPLYYIPE